MGPNGGSSRALITGLGAITPLGNSVPDFWSGLINGVSGIGPVTLFDTSDLPCHIGGQVNLPEDCIPFKERRRMARFTQFAMLSAAEALTHAGLCRETLSRADSAIVLGSGGGGLMDSERELRKLIAEGRLAMDHLVVPKAISNVAACQIAMKYGITGSTLSVTTACAASANALGIGLDMIRNRRAQLVLCVGAEAPLSPFFIHGFSVLRALSHRENDPSAASRPFDSDRDGFVLSEGAAAVVLESEEFARGRGATPLAELAGYGSTSDAYHIVAPEPAGVKASEAIERALNDAGIEPEDVDYVAAHGTSTVLNDVAETVALKKALGAHAARIPVSAIKSMTGHPLGAAGAMQAVACVRALQEGIVPPTINYHSPDPKCDLDYVPNEARRHRVRCAISTSLAFGGHNVCLVFRQAELN